MGSGTDEPILVGRIPEILPRKTLKFVIEEDGSHTPEEDLRHLGLGILSGATTMTFRLAIEVDGETILNFPKIQHFDYTNPMKLLEVESRLRLLEDILRSCDVNGTALVVRDIGQYTVVPHGTYTLMSNDPDDKD